MWEHLHLDEFFDCIFIDLPGHGLSGEIEQKDISIADMAEHILETLSPLQLEKLHVVGHSLGGYVALEILDRCTIAEKCVLMNSNFWTDSDEKKADRLRVVDLIKKNKELFLKAALPGLFAYPELYKKELTQLVREAQKMSEHSISAVTLAMRTRKDFSKQLLDWGDRIGIIQGELDTSTTFDDMKARILKQKMLMLPACGHMSHFERSNSVRLFMKEFLAQ
jgi:pimeloyl-ACP methyl ester carboxylesterase